MSCKLYSPPLQPHFMLAFLKAFHDFLEWWPGIREDSFGSPKKDTGGARDVIGRRLGKGGAAQVGFQIA